MKDEKKVNKAEEVKEEVKAEENGVELTDEQMAEVNGGATPEQLRALIELATPTTVQLADLIKN